MIDHAISYAAYCQEVLVPVWERWGTPRSALREALACDDDRAQGVLREAVLSIFCLHDGPGMHAAACAGLASLSALQGTPDVRFWKVAELALAEDRAALARRAQA
jgi:hypothetical protein